MFPQFENQLYFNLIIVSANTMWSVLSDLLIKQQPNQSSELTGSTSNNGDKSSDTEGSDGERLHRVFCFT